MNATTTLLHLEEHLADAAISGGAAPGAARGERRWTFDEARPEWKAVSSERFPRLAAVALDRLQDGLRLSLGRPARQQGPLWIGGIAIDTGGAGALADWEGVHVRARSRERFAGMTVAYNLDD